MRRIKLLIIIIAIVLIGCTSWSLINKKSSENIPESAELVFKSILFNCRKSY